MRSNPTKAEKVLWQALRKRTLGGLKFRRQEVIGSFIADFYNAAARLVIEVDGDIHDNQKDVDEARSRQFEDYGYKVIRFDNEMVLDRLEEVLVEIEAKVRERIIALNNGKLTHNALTLNPLTPNPSPNPGRGEQERRTESSRNTGRGEPEGRTDPSHNPGRGAEDLTHPEPGDGDTPLPLGSGEGAGG